MNAAALLPVTTCAPVGVAGPRAVAAFLKSKKQQLI